MGENFYNAAKVEEEINTNWKKKKIASKFTKAGSKRPKFYFLDGPPFVTNEVHEGTMLGYFLKDTVVRFKTMTGFDVKMQPGWDTHGLPIEVAVEKRLGIKNKKEIKEFGESKFIEECKKFVEEYISLNTAIMLNFGLVWYYNEPYRTYDDNFIEGVWGAIKRADELGILYKGYKTTWFCVRCGTPMANYEIRDKYYPREDPSLYVLFPLEDGRFMLVWTTTPWTLPSNAAIAINGGVKYIEAEIEGKTIILAKDREEVLKQSGKEYKIKNEIDGKDLLSLKYVHPFGDLPQIKENAERLGRIINGGGFVTTEGVPFVETTEGTGVVHVAPGHGDSDYKIGIENGLPVMSPISEDGKYTERAGWLKDENVFKANDKVIEYLNGKGLVFSLSKTTHNYPHCWRCKTPLIQRASDQWFFDIGKIKNKLIEASKEVAWIPEISSQAFESWLSNAQDWVISRQRYWNTPLPIWQCEKCGERKVVGTRNELSELSGIKKIKDLHFDTLRDIKFTCSKCGGDMRRIEDVADVWLDSGSASFASIAPSTSDDKFKRWFPVDFISEGNDQIRGWFYSLLVMGYIATGKLAYKNVVMHKFVIGEDRQKLSKSVGNYTPLAELLKQGHSRDALRLSLLRKRLEDEIVFSMKGLQDEVKTLNVLYNLGNLYSSLVPEYGKGGEMPQNISETVDRWIASRWNKTKQTVKDELERYRTDHAVNMLVDFVNDDFSKTYVKLVKGRLFDESDDIAFAVFSVILKEFCTIFSLFAPYVSEHTRGLFDRSGSVLLENYPKISKELINDELELKIKNTLNVMQDVLSAREKMKLAIKRPIKSLYLPGVGADNILEGMLKSLVNVLHVSYVIDEKEYETSLNYKSLGEKYSKDDVAKIIGKFIELTNSTLFRNVSTGMKLSMDGKEYRIAPEDITLKPKTHGIEVFDGQRTKVIVDTAVDGDIIKLWMKREITRGIQSLRKELGLERKDRIKIGISIDTKEIGPDFKDMMAEIKAKTNSIEAKGKTPEKIKEIDVNGKKIVISVFKSDRQS